MERNNCEAWSEEGIAYDKAAYSPTPKPSQKHMTGEKEYLLSKIKESVLRRIDKKFRKGNEEHGEDMSNLDLVAEALDEVIDAVVYLIIAKEACDTKTSTHSILQGNEAPYTKEHMGSVRESLGKVSRDEPPVQESKRSNKTRCKTAWGCIAQGS